MGSLAAVICVIIVAQVVRDIFKEVIPNKRELIELQDKVSGLEARLAKVDVKKLEAMRGDIQALKLNVPTRR